MTEILQLPAHEPRVESGPIQFGTDWPGVFIRGDNALFFARAVEQAAQRLDGFDGDPILAAQLKGLASDLQACSVGDTGWPPIDTGTMLKPQMQTIERSQVDSLVLVAREMFVALLGLQVIAEQHVTDLAAEIQEGRPGDPRLRMEMARWSAVGAAIELYTGFVAPKGAPG